MATASTTVLPLTTTFTPPADCRETPHFHASGLDGTDQTYWAQAPGASTASCFPPAFPLSGTATIGIIYSPGICPVWWTSACQRVITISSSTLDVVTCCPQSMECVSSTTYGWQAFWGCVAPFTYDPLTWPSTDQPYLSLYPSMYQRQIMIVEQATTTSPTSDLPTIHSPSSNTASNTGSSTTASTTAGTVGSHELSKGAISGIAVGAVVAVAVIASLAYVAWAVKTKRTVQAPAYVSPPEYVADKHT